MEWSGERRALHALHVSVHWIGSVAGMSGSLALALGADKLKASTSTPTSAATSTTTPPPPASTHAYCRCSRVKHHTLQQTMSCSTQAHMMILRSDEGIFEARAHI